MPITKEPHSDLYIYVYKTDRYNNLLKNPIDSDGPQLSPCLSVRNSFNHKHWHLTQYENNFYIYKAEHALEHPSLCTNGNSSEIPNKVIDIFNDYISTHKKNNFIDRIIEENLELKEKSSKLSTFIKSDKFKKLNVNQRLLLNAQQETMKAYIKIGRAHV